jgi:hypothetical protein
LVSEKMARWHAQAVKSQEKNGSGIIPADGPSEPGKVHLASLPKLWVEMSEAEKTAWCRDTWQAAAANIRPSGGSVQPSGGGEVSR